VPLATIAGTVPELADLPAGCAFAERCPLAIDPCRAAMPADHALGAGHSARCIRIGPAG
jgi:peptide/nickel transport system ATP-binding protein